MAILFSLAARIAWGAGAALFTLLLCSLFTVDLVPAAIPLALLLLGAVAVWSPASALAIVVILLPIASWIGRTWHERLAWPEAVALAFLAGYAVQRAFLRRDEAGDTLHTAVYALIAIVTASVAVQVQVLAGTTGWARVLSDLQDLAVRQYFIVPGDIAGIDAAMRLIEGLLLAHAAAVVVSADGSARRRLLAAVSLGAVAASALNLWRLWIAALRFDSPVATFFEYLTTLRYNVHYGDLNAAGSYFVMALLPALAFMRTSSWWRWFLPAVLILISLSLSGSRTALVAGAIALAILLFARRSRTAAAGSGRRGTAGWVAGATVAVVVTAVLLTALQRNVTPTSAALQIRVEFARVSLAMVGARPAFGIGVGQFPERLADFSTPMLNRLYPVPRENAHNNLLQILAELGVAGFAAAVGLLGLGTWRMIGILRDPSSDAVDRAAAAGVFAFILTWLSGHPLLVDEPALCFWVMFGLLAAAAPGAAGVRSGSGTGAAGISRWGRPVTAAAAALLIVSIPLRAQHELGTTSLEHRGIGVSDRWLHDDEFPYRSAAGRFVLFLPTEHIIDLPMRATTSRSTILVDLVLDGNLVDRVEVSSTEWRLIRIVLPRSGRFYERVQFVPDVADGQEATIRVGKAIDRGPVR